MKIIIDNNAYGPWSYKIYQIALANAMVMAGYY